MEIDCGELRVEHRPVMPNNEREHARLMGELKAIELDGHPLSEAEVGLQ